MPDFHYIARDNAGQKITGVIQAAGRREATAALVAQARCFPWKSARPSSRSSRKKSAASRPVAGHHLRPIGRSARAAACPLLRSLEVIQKQTSHAGLKHILGEVHRQVEDGSTLADAMNRFPRIFGEMAVSMIRAGGEGGFLEEALTRVAQFTEAQDDMKKRTMGAVAYPAFLCVVGMSVVTVLIVFFVPKFSEPFRPSARARRTARRHRLAPLASAMPCEFTAGGWSWP